MRKDYAGMFTWPFVKRNLEDKDLLSKPIRRKSILEYGCCTAWCSCGWAILSLDRTSSPLRRGGTSKVTSQSVQEHRSIPQSPFYIVNDYGLFTR